MDDTLAERIEGTLRNMGWSGEEAPVNGAVPPSATDGKRVYLNWLGIVFAVDAKTGKLLWRSRKFSDLSNQAQQFVYGGVNISRYTMALSGNKVFVTGLPLEPELRVVISGIILGQHQPHPAHRSVEPLPARRRFSGVDHPPAPTNAAEASTNPVGSVAF